MGPFVFDIVFFFLNERIELFFNLKKIS